MALGVTSKSAGAAGGEVPSLTGVRAVSVSFVLFGHLCGTSGFPFPSSAFAATLAALGVLVFFVVSGFLITTLLMRERASTGTVSLRAFYARRCARILPAASAYLAVVGLLGIAGVLLVDPLQWLSAALYVSNWISDRGWITGHFWSLAVEEQFYLLWPACFVLLRRRPLLLVCLLTVAVGPLGRLAAMLMAPKAPAPIFPAVADALAAGCLTALYGHRIPPVKALAALASLGGLAVIVGLQVRWWWVALLGQTISAFLICILLLHVTRCAHPLLNSRVLNWFGGLSYALYLWQQPFLNRHSSAWWCAWPINLVLALSAAVLSFYVVERPARAWLRERLTPRRSTRTLVATSPVIPG